MEEKKLVQLETRTTGTCVACGRALTNSDSIEAFMGPICRGYYGSAIELADILGVEENKQKFDEAIKGQSKKRKSSIAWRGMKFIQALYGIERRYKDAKPEVRHRARQEQARPILTEIVDLTNYRCGHSQLAYPPSEADFIYLLSH